MDRFKHFFTQHKQASLNALHQITHTPFASFITCLVIGITLTLPLILYVSLKNAETLRNRFQQATQMTLYLKENTSPTQAQTLATFMTRFSPIAKVRMISPEEGLTELQQQAGLLDLSHELQNNPLPWSIVLTLKTYADSPKTIERFMQQLKQYPEIEKVQLDMLWVKRLNTLLQLATRIVLALAIFLGTAVFIMINTAIESTTQQRQQEINIIQLVGGTNAFIRRPFLYAGMFYGLLGAMVAWQIVDLLLLTIQGPSRHLAHLYHSTFHLYGLGLTETIILFVASILLGLLGSWLAVNRGLRTSET